MLRIIGQPEIEGWREAEQSDNLLLQRRKRRHMSLDKARSTSDTQRYFAESFQQAFRRGLTGATFGIASKQASQFHLLLRETLPDHALQQGHHAQGDGQQANKSSPMVIALHIQRSKPQRAAF